MSEEEMVIATNQKYSDYVLKKLVKKRYNKLNNIKVLL